MPIAFYVSNYSMHRMELGPVFTYAGENYLENSEIISKLITTKLSSQVDMDLSPYGIIHISMSAFCRENY